MGGISNVTYFDHRNKNPLKKIVAFDTGPCCSLIDDWVTKKSNNKFDKNGKLAKKGEAKKKIIKLLLQNPYFSKKNPKSLDRSTFNLSLLKKIECNDGAATLSHFAAESISKGFKFFPKNPELIILSGGGRNNKFLVKLLKNKIKNSKIVLSEKYNWDGDSIEAYAFAYLSIRRLLNLPITFPGTTGSKKELIGGDVFFPF